MPQSSTTDYQLHFILLNEWRHQSDPSTTTKIINKRLGKNSIDLLTVQKHFNQFDEGNTSHFSNESKLQISVQKSSDVQSFLFMSNDEYSEVKMIGSSGQFLTYFYCHKNERFIVQHNLLLNKKSQIPILFKISNATLLNNNLLLVHGENDCELRIFELNFHSLTIKLLDLIKIDTYLKTPFSSIIPDQLDNNKFMIKYRQKLALGQVQDEKIVLKNFKDFPACYLYGKRLVDKKFQGFDYSEESSLTTFCEIDLDSMKRREVEAPIVLDGESEENPKYYVYKSCWSKNRFYGMFEMNDNRHHLLTFNLESMRWSNVGISVKIAQSLFIDWNETLVLQTGAYSNGTNAFYRVELRKPDTLKNLSLLCASRQSNVYANEKYLKCVCRFQLQN